MKYRMTKNKRTAFSMIELVFVIVVIGILSALTLPRLERDLRQEAVINILSAIRYTQHLALNDDKTDPFDSAWQKKLWAIRFTVDSSDPKGTFYTIASDFNKSGTIAKTETAIDPANGKYMYNTSGATVGIDADESPSIFIGKKYGISNITFSGGCTQHHIGFDQVGRPHVEIGGATNDYHTYMTSDCNITFSFIDSDFDPFSIIIEKETGYAYVEGQHGS